MTPADKLERSRLAIIEYLARGEKRHERRDEPQDFDDADEAAGGPGFASRLFARNRWLSGMSSAARTWWSHHPAQMAVEMATPALRGVMRKHPFPVLGACAGVGALLVVTRPWRLISLTTLVVAIVKSSQLSGVVMSALTNAQGWHEQQRGREPHL
ncbi:hypothetical protein ACFPOE_12295 [Caenimonas terrae]|uniref:Uncharacterized protein n=1 Tax=Caenimonas terrae TaxID=696074 RepID=A0ABW0NCD1_9BURK